MRRNRVVWLWLALCALASLAFNLAAEASDFAITLTSAPTVNIDVAAASVFKITPDQNIAFTASNAIVRTGTASDTTRVLLVFVTSGTTSFSMSFGSGFSACGLTVQTGVTDANTFAVEFYAIGANLYAPACYELWRSPAFSKTGVRISGDHKVGDVATLSSGSVTVTLTGQSVYSSSTSYLCTPTSRTATRANIASFGVTYASGSQFTITSSNAADAGTVQFECVGN